MSETSVTIDWLSVTYAYGARALPWSLRQASPARIAERVTGRIETWEDTKPRFGYTCGLQAKDVPGLVVFSNPSRPDMGVHVQWTGRALSKCFIPDVLDAALSGEGRVTRIDIAVDTDQALDIPALYEQATAGQWQTKARSAPTLMVSNGATLYVGSRTSEKYLRIYDKGAEQGSEAPWTRIELECKGEFARGVAGYLNENGWNRIPDLIRGYCDFPTDPTWTEVMSSPTPPMSIPKAERMTDTVTWLLTSVAPTLARHLCTDLEFSRRWTAALASHMVGQGRAGDADPFDGKADFDVH